MSCRKRTKNDLSDAAPCPKVAANANHTTLSELTSLTFAMRHIPDRTPKRWDLVNTFISDGNTDKCSLQIQLPHGNTLVKKSKDYKALWAHINQCWPDFHEYSDEMLQSRMGSYPDKSGLKHILLLPSVKECRFKPVIIRNRPSFPLVYTMQGTFVAAMYSAECKHCTRKFHISYYHEEREYSQKAQYYYGPEDAKYFQVTSQTVFEIALLNDITNNISISAASFESRAKVYNENFQQVDQERLCKLAEFGRSQKDNEHPWKVTEKRIEDAWFLFSLVNFYKERGVLKTTNFATKKLVSQRYDVDGMCERAWELITSTTNPWVQHQCTTVGCSEGYCSLDGLEKVSRAMCAASDSRISGGTAPELRVLKVIQCCPESPIMGGKHINPSKYCETHAQKDKEIKPQSIALPPEHRHYSQQTEEIQLPENDDDTLLVGCKKSKNVNKFYDRTAGLLALVRPCGIIVNFCEMFTCESATQAYVFTFTTFGRSLDDLSRLKYLGYDRACDLQPFLKNLKRRGSLGAKILLDHVKFMVDLWHCHKHKEDTCMPLENPNCKFHPKLQTFSEVHGVNTECAEQAFKWLGKFKFITRKMTRHRYCFFIWKVIDEHNKMVERQLKCQ